MTQLLPPKKEVALALLERSNVDVYLDPRAKGVVVPPQFRKEPRLILKIGLNMPVPIPDLRVDDDSMSCTLSFNRSPFYCVVPWSSVFAMVGEDGRGMVWPDDVPQELAVKVVEPSDARQPAAPAAPAPSTAGSGRRGARASKIASTSDTSAERPARNGKKKATKKKDEGRPVLVAVPSGSSVPSGSPPPSQRESRTEAAAGSDRPREIRQAPEHRAPPSTQQRDGQQRDGVSAIGNPTPPRPRQPSQHPPPSARRPDGTIARPKRELPPYLRVVK